MGLFYRKPFFLCCFFVLLGAFLIVFASPSIANLTLMTEFALIVLSLTVSLFRKNKSLFFFFALPLFCALLSSVYFITYSQNKTEMIKKYTDDNSHEIESVVIKNTYLSNYLSVYEAECILIDNTEIKTKVYIDASFYLKLTPGEVVRTSVFFYEPTPDQKSYYNSKGIYLFANIASDEVEKIGDKKDISLHLSRLRSVLTGVIYDGIENDAEAGLVSAVFLGDRDGLTMNAKRDFKRAGGYHLLALSGMHLSVFCAAVNVLLRAFKLKKGKRNIVLSIVVVFYVALTGFQLSMVRSAIMLFSTFAGYYMRSRRDAFTSLAFAAATIIIFSPSSVFDVGLWMSVSATFGIILAIPLDVYIRFKIRRIVNKTVRKAVSYIASVLVFSVVATVMVFPFSCFCFGGVSLLGPLTTLLISGAVSLILVTAPIALITSWIPFVSKVVFCISALGAKLVLVISELLSELENVFVSLEYEFVPYLVIPFFIILFVLLTVRLKHKWLIPLFIVAWLFVFSVFEIVAINSSALVCEYTVLGKNEYFSIAVGGRNLLVDISDGSYAKLSKASADASSKGYCELDAVVLTHFHRRHITSLVKLSSAYMLRSVYLPTPETTAELDIAKEIEVAMAYLDIPVSYYDKLDRIEANGVQLNVERAYLKRSTHPVIGITISDRLDIKYYSSSFSEHGELNTCENVIFGVHGPVCKSGFVFDASGCSLLSFATEEIYSLCTITNSTDDLKTVKAPKKMVFKYN